MDRFVVKLTGKGTHAAHPHDGIDIVLVAAQIVTAAQSIVSRNIDPFSQGLLSITRVTAGNTWNVIPDTAELEGTVRTIGKTNRALIEERLRALVEHVALSQGAGAELVWMAGPPATDNAPCLAPLVTAVAEERGLTSADDASVVAAMAADPKLIERPLVETEKGVRLCRPPEKVQEIL